MSPPSLPPVMRAVDARMKGSSMRLAVLTILVLIGSVTAGERLAGPQSNYLRCAAVDHILSQQHPDVSQRGSFKKEMELHGKWASWFYRENHANYMADATVAMKEVQEDLKKNAYATDGFIAEMNSCTALQVRTLDAFVNCLGPQPPTDADKERCAKKAVGL